MKQFAVLLLVAVLLTACQQTAAIDPVGEYAGAMTMSASTPPAYYFSVTGTVKAAEAYGYEVIITGGTHWKFSCAGLAVDGVMKCGRGYPNYSAFYWEGDITDSSWQGEWTLWDERAVEEDTGPAVLLKWGEFDLVRRESRW